MLVAIQEQFECGKYTSKYPNMNFEFKYAGLILEIEQKILESTTKFLSLNLKFKVATEKFWVWTQNFEFKHKVSVKILSSNTKFVNVILILEITH